ncbi:hypothetical protein ACF0H5_023862 [Mactra antiquata]
MQEGYGGMTDSDWRPVARDVTRPDITVGDISPKKDYRFRIRAELENGDVSEPTPPIQYYRSHLPALREPLTDYKLVEYEAVFLNRPYFDHLTKYVPPRMPIEKPEMSIIDQESVELTWKPAIVAEAIKGMCNLSYTIEVRCPPNFEWRELVTGIRICSYTVTKLHPRIDYVFRIRAWNEYGTSETTLPVSLYRPQALKSEEDDDAEFEREWELKYGAQDADPNACMTKVPPKLPMDTPRIVTQTPESIWFSWLSARIPAYATQTNINYVVEVKEPPSTAWRREATSIVDCQYVLEGLNPNQEYHIRVRAETEFGPSEPTMPIIIRGKGSRPGSRRSSVDRDDINLEGKLDVSYLENLMSGVPPRMPSTRPIATNAEPDKLTLKWSSCRTPSYVRASNVTYVVEKRELPSHIWSVVAKDIKGTKYEVTGLNGDQDYMFRVRAKNEYGVSDPTLPMTIYRDRDDYVPPRIRSRSSSRDSLFGSRSAPRGRSTSVDYSGSRFEDIERSSVDRLPCEPELTTTTNYDVQYGMIGNKGKITLKVKAYPLPTVHWYFNDTKIEYGDLYNSFVTPTGDVVLEMKRVGPDSAGFYKCFAENASGSASKTVTFELAEPPTVLEPLQDVIVTDHEPVKFMCRVDGFPNATIKWTKDWRPIAGSTHCKISNPSSEVYQIEIPNCVDTDAGLYACTIENLAGKVVLTARLTVEIGQMIVRGKYIEDLLDTLPATFDNVNIRSTPIEDRYHVLEEIGRGRFGIVRRIIEMSTGRTFAANYMSFRNKSQKHFFMSEFQTLCSLSQTDGILKLYDAFETDRSLIFVTEYLSEPDLLEKVIKDGNWTESNVAVFIKKLLTLLLELEKLNILHLDIKPGNIRMTGSGLTEPKLIGFGYSRTLVPEEEITQNYGSIGYASPEQITNDVVTQASDLWSVGVLAYLLLSGTSPFQSGSEVEVLSLTSECLWTFEGRGFDNFSKEAKDFIGRLLVRDPKQRMTLSECLEHPWLSTESNTKINTDRLKQFNNAEQIQRNLEKVYTTVQLQSFAKIIHGRKALYQPAVDIESGEIIFPDSDEFGNYLDEDAWYQWQLQYLDDPDSQIYPIQDEGFTVRECRHAGAPKFSKPKIKERSDRDDVDSGTGILFRDKIQPTTFKPGDEATFTCTVICEKKNVTPIITWYRDESLLSDDYRSEAEFNPDTGVAKLTILNTKDYDSAVYKCVARIKDGRVSCQARLYLGDIPSKPGRPLVMQTSGTEAFLTWNCPDSDGNSYILGYRVDYRKNKYTTWNIGPYVTEEYALISGLSPDTSYIFRVCCSNKYGTSPFSWSSLECKTSGADAPKVSVAADLLPVMQFSTFDKQQTVLQPESRRPSLTVPEEATMSESDPNETFTFSDIISKGSYGEYRSCINKSTNQQCVAKIMPYNTDNEATVRAEFDLLHTLRQNNLITVLDSYIHGDKMYVIHEYLSGMNVIEYLCLHKTYSEEKVAFLVRQILDAVSFIQHYGIVHLNLQPSSIAMASTRRPHIKLRDFTLAQKIDRDVGMTGAPAGYPDFTCPEVLKEEKVSFTADIWTIGALTFTMLSGVSPFCGKTIEETLSRILFDRYSTKEMYDNVSKESIKFVCKLMSRLPRNRPTVNKCLDSQWMNLNESMVNSRSTKHFKSDRLRIFLKYYMGQRGNEDYKVAKVDIATLPKIVPAPQTEPILSDKILNKLEIETPTVSLADVLHAEAAKIPELPLLEKLLYKIELEKAAIEEETEVKIEVEQGDTAVEAEAEKVRVDEGLIADECKKTESGLKPEEATVGDDNEKSKSVDRSRSISVDRSKIAKAKKVIKVKGSEVDVSINEELSVKKVEKEVAAEHVVETVNAETSKELAKNNTTEARTNEKVTDETKEPIKQSEVSEVIESVEGKRLETEKTELDTKLAEVSKAESGDASTDILDKKETKVEETAVDKKSEKVEEVQQTSVAEDTQPGSDAPEGKVEVHEADDEFVDALESITPDVKSVDKTVEAESKEDVVDDGAEDEFSEAPETNGHDEHPQVVEENNEQKIAPSELSNESMQTIDNLAETKAEEIKTAALKEIAEGISQNKHEPSKVSEVADESSTSYKEADASLNDDKPSADTVTDAADESVQSAVAVDDNAETEDASKPMPVDASDEKANIAKSSRADNEKSGQPSEEVIECVSKETSDVDSATKSVDSPKPEEAGTSTDDTDSKAATSPEQKLTETDEKIVEKVMEEAVSAVAPVGSSDANSTDIKIKEDKSDKESGQEKNKDETDKVETDSNAAGEVTDTSQTEASDKLKSDKLKFDTVSQSDIIESDSVMKVDNEASKSEETCKDSSAKDESKSPEQSVVEKEEAVKNVKTEDSKDSTDAASTSSDVSVAVGDNDRDVALDSKSVSKNESETAEATTKQREEIGTLKEEVASVISSTSESAKQTEATEKVITESDAKEESGASEVADTKADLADESKKGEDVSVLESASAEEAKTSESIAEGDSIVSETIKESESKETCESKEAASRSTKDTVSESNSTVQSISESSESIVSESVTENKESVSECSIKEETVVTESMSKTETVVSESESSTSKTLVSENDSKSNETVNDDKTVNVDSANVEAKETDLSGSISQSELIESETVSKEESSNSEISKTQTETSESNVDKSDNESESKEISESCEIVSEKDKDKLLNVQTGESFEVKKCEIKELNTEDSSETVSTVVTDKQVTAEQAFVENVSQSDLTTDTVESTLSENIVATQQSSSENVESALEKTTTVVETVEQSFVDGKLEVTERKETNVVVTEKMSPEEAVIVESSSTKSEKSASVNDEVDSANTKVIVTEGQESATVEVQSSQESASVETVTSEEVSESVSKLVKNESEVTEIVSMERKETLISGSTVTESSEEITTVSSSVVEETVSEMAEASNLEIAKPDEEKIAKETSVNQYLDDALMFC